MDLVEQQLYKVEVNGKIVTAMYTGEGGERNGNYYYIFTTLEIGGGENVGILKENILNNNKSVSKIPTEADIDLHKTLERIRGIMGLEPLPSNK